MGSATDGWMMLHFGGGYFDMRLMLLSYVVATFASYTALTMVDRVARESDRSAHKWLVVGSFVMGIGIWSMHFVGMLAFSMDMPFSYDIGLTVFSLFIGVICSLFAIYAASREDVGWSRLIGGGLLLGPGIAGMHYSGMAAMEMPAALDYDPFLFVLSVVIAIVASIAALWIATSLKKSHSNVELLKIGGALVMGIAICGMHYTGMAAAIYLPTPHAGTEVVETPDNGWLAVLLAIATIGILGLTLVLSFLEKKSRSAEQVNLEAGTGSPLVAGSVHRAVKGSAVSNTVIKPVDAA